MKLKLQMKGRSLLTLDGITCDELLGLLDLAQKLKKKKKAGVRGDLLDRKNLVMIFEKMSTRTRCAFAVAAADEGARIEYLSADEIHLGKKESVVDTARVLGRMFDGIAFRGYRQATVEQFAKFSGVPVWNALTDDSHPTQALADLMTVREKFGRLAGLKVVYMGDGRNNVANSLMAGCAKAGIHYTVCAPAELTPAGGLLSQAEETARRAGGSVTVSQDPRRAARGANVVYTDVWASMGEECKMAERIRLLAPYRVDMETMRGTGNLEKGQAIFLHCLPAFHDHNTDFTRERGAMEVTNDVFEAPFSLVLENAENRVHTIKALLVATL